MLDRLDIAMTPAEALLLPPADCYLVIDALRATTTVATLFARGLRRLTAVSTLDAGRALRRPGVLLFGEQGGLRPEGFDYGNSPMEAATLDLQSREAVLVTSNGTVALCAVASQGSTAAASLANLSAVREFALGHASAIIVCSGNGGATRFSLEDFATASAIAQGLQRTAPGLVLGDGALLGVRVPDPSRLVAVSSHSDILRRLSLEEDVDFAMRIDSSPVTPIVTSFGEGWVVLEARVPR